MDYYMQVQVPSIVNTHQGVHYLEALLRSSAML